MNHCSHYPLMKNLKNFLWTIPKWRHPVLQKRSGTVLKEICCGARLGTSLHSTFTGFDNSEQYQSTGAHWAEKQMHSKSSWVCLARINTVWKHKKFTCFQVGKICKTLQNAKQWNYSWQDKKQSLYMYSAQTRVVANTLMTNLSTKLRKCWET